MPAIPALYRLLILAALLAITGCVSTPPVYLTWQGDTSTTMTINWLSSSPHGPSVVHYDTASHDGAVDAYAGYREGQPVPLLGKEARYLHRVALDGLEPDTTYYFTAGSEDVFFPEAKFRTLPNDPETPVRVVIGGDQGPTLATARLFEHAASFGPQACIIGGDIAYANGDPDNLALWDLWFWHYRRKMVTPEGYLIPMILGIGNHELNDSDGAPEDRAPWYFEFFDQDPRSYFTRNLGGHTLAVLLDTGHLTPHDGAQRDWLEEQLEANTKPNVLAIYHVGLFPSHRPADNSAALAGRTHWQPLFEQYGVDVGFEHHDHAYKRTYPILGDAVDPNGIVYLGDGCFGIFPRRIDNEGAWYLERAASTRHFWLVDLSRGQIHCRAINLAGEVFDEVTL